jgi:transposase
MPKSPSGDLRERVIEAVEAGASRREAAERFELSPSSAVRWLQRWRDHGVCAPKPRGGSRSVLEDYAQRILALVDEQPDRTLDELVAAMHKRRIAGSRSALWRFLDRHGITFKKKACGQPSSTERTWRELAALAAQTSTVVSVEFFSIHPIASAPESSWSSSVWPRPSESSTSRSTFQQSLWDCFPHIGTIGDNLFRPNRRTSENF